MKELVSILIPAYNAERWIGETIKSILSQTWSNYETIVVDDGSSDTTFAIARRFQSKTVRVITQENMGASAARNKALSLAQGDYIQWLDADDLLAPDKIAHQLKDGEQGKNSSVLLSSAFGKFSFRPHKARFVTTALWRDLTPVEWFIARFSENVWMFPAAWLVSRRLTERIGPWDERLSLNDDGEYFGRAVAACDEVKFVPEAKSYYRQANGSSLSKTVTHEACESLFLSMQLCIEYLLALENSDRTRAAALTYVQDKLIYFYPEKKELLGKAAALAESLGGTLSPPELKKKYILASKLLGWQTAKKLVFAIPRLKKSAFGNYDRLMYLFTKPPS